MKSNSINTHIIWATCLFISTAASASVYQCEKNGVVEFSQLPCGEDAKLITIKEQNPFLSNAVQGESTESVYSQTTGQVDSYIRTKQIAAEIAEHNNKIDTFKLRMNNEIAALNNQSDAQLQNLVGAKKQAAIAKQMSAVSERYAVLIDNEQRSIDRLIAENNRINNSFNELSNNDEVDSFIRSKQIMQQISEHENKIDTYNEQLNQQISLLEKQVSHRPNNLADANSDQALVDKMSALTSRFNTLISVEQRQIDRLRNELSQL
ncbi:MAG: DUF4124 domain-containing protein [Pseudoalteromonas sp.]|uniref:DUF4124 domain-containing protein n=1 Tax=Pseudoalteromonas sp. TaxID=53249 RepID=UPI0026004C3A|nr:DUF4124 domain-containing protein [Pseudoalteromonas sp.]MCH2086854.1 DUF4124 domain-containing protein [Pseudoalteromonas sp.]